MTESLFYSNTNISRHWRSVDAVFFLFCFVLFCFYFQAYFPNGVVATPLRIISTEGHITLTLVPVYYSYGRLLSIDSKINTNY